MKYFVQISGKNYLDRQFYSFKTAEKYAAECGFSEYVNNVNNGNTIESQTYYYIEPGDSLENYDYGFEPCMIEEIED